MNPGAEPIPKFGPFSYVFSIKFHAFDRRTPKFFPKHWFRRGDGLCSFSISICCRSALSLKVSIVIGSSFEGKSCLRESCSSCGGKNDLHESCSTCQLLTILKLAADSGKALDGAGVKSSNDMTTILIGFDFPLLIL